MSEQLQLGVTMYDRWRELDARVTEVLRSPELDEKDKEILRVIAGHKGAAQAIRAGEIAERTGMLLGELSRRKVTSTIETLRLLFRLPIGASRTQPYGYFLIVSAEDLELAVKPLWGEVYAHLRMLRALMPRKAVARLYGQAMLKLDKEEQPKEAA